jgi:cation channel sperm-associated protein 2
LRILRTLRTLKAIVRFGSLQIIVNTILDAFQSMTFIMLALILVTYIVAIFGIQLFESYTYSTLPDLEFQSSFENIGEAFLTLFQLLTLDQWYAMQDDISRVINPAIVAIYFLFWVWLGAFIFRNIFIGVMVKNFQNLSERLAREGEEAKKKKKLERLGQQLHKNLTLQTSVLKGNQNNQGANGEGFVPGTNWADTRALSPEPGPSKGSSPSSLPGIRGAARRGSGFGSTLGADLVHHGSHAHLNLLKQQAQLRAASNSSPAESVNLGNLNERVLRTANDAGIWDNTVANTLQALAASKEETMWPRDTLFKYLQVMESLQENLAEYYELQMLAATALNQINDN